MASSVGVGLIKLVVWVYDVITYPIYSAIQRPGKRLRIARQVMGVNATGNPEGPYKKTSTIDDNSNQSQSKESIQLRTKIQSRVRTLYDLLDYAEEQYRVAGRSCVGVREVLSEYNDIIQNGHYVQKFELGQYHWLSFAEVKARVLNFGKGLRCLGIQRHDRVVVFAETRMEWLIASLACFQEGYCIVTLYPTLGDEGLIHSLNESESSHLITSVDLLDKVKSLLPNAPKFTDVICMQAQLGLKRNISTDGLSARLHTFEYVETMGVKSNLPRASPPAETDLACLMYTSGSTGMPKGVMFQHGAVIETLVCYIHLTRNKTVTISYLPMAHILGFIADLLCLLNGVSIAYSSPLTLTDASLKVKSGCKGDITVAKPDFMCAVPLVLDRIYKAVNQKMAASHFKKNLFSFAYQYRLSSLRNGCDTPIMNRLFFSKVAAALGGRVRTIVVGGANVNAQIEEFVHVCFGVRMTQVYGLTETSGMGTFVEDYDLKYGRIGPPSINAEIRLDSWEEGGYTVGDKPNPRGEMLINIPHMTSGYLNLPDKTAEDFVIIDNRKWFRTGDIGEVDNDGCFKIIDRKKDLIKLQHGEYISLARIETQLKLSSVFDNVCVYCDGQRAFAVAIVVPNEAELRRMAAELNKPSGLTLAQICADADVNRCALTSMADCGKQCGLSKFEIPSKIVLVGDLWTPDSGLVTATMKLKRKALQTKYQHQIDTMYNQ